MARAKKPQKYARRNNAEETTESRKTKGVLIRRRVNFSVDAEPGSTVYLAGIFNDWSVDKKQLKDAKGTGRFTGFLFLLPGRYEYKFIINGIWEIDSQNPDFVPTCMNSLNSVIGVE